MSIVAGIMLTAALPISAAADDDGRSKEDVPARVQITQIDVGIKGHYKVGRWTPVSVQLTGEVTDPVHIAVWVPDPDGNLTKQPSPEFTLAGSGPHRLQSVFRSGRMDGVIRVDVESAGQILATKSVRSASDPDDRTSPLFPPDPLSTTYWIVVGDATGFQQAAARINREHSASVARGSLIGNRDAVTVISLSDVSELPTQPDGLDGVDVIALQQVTRSGDETDRALRNWVKAGGHLVISINSAERWMQSRLSSWVPVLREVGASRLRDLGQLRSQFEQSELFRAGTVDALQFDYEYGETLAGSLDGPLWVRVPFSFGRVTLLGLDIGQRPLDTWDALPQLCQRLADYQQERSGGRQTRTAARLSTTGVSDLATQLAAAVDRFPEIRTPSNWTVMGLMILYFLIIGPLDYLVVHRVLRRPHWTWMTFPAIVLGAAALASASAWSIHPAKIVANQVNLVDLDPQSGSIRNTHWSSFVSPDTKRRSVEVTFGQWRPGRSDPSQDAPASPFSRVSWLGIPETGFRGMYRSGGLDLAKPRYQFAAGNSSIENVPVSVGSSASFTATHIERSAGGGTFFDSDLSALGGQLFGTVTNRLDVPIEDWFIAHNKIVYFPESRQIEPTSLAWKAGDTISTSQDRRLRSLVLRSYLTGVTRMEVKREGERFSVNTASRDSYDPIGRDFDRIVRAISFYQECGGKEFTTVENDGLRHLDLSPMLSLGRAVLFGRIDTLPSQLRVDGEVVEPSESPTFIRVLLPVRHER